MTEKTPQEYEAELKNAAKAQAHAGEALGVGVGALSGAGLGAVGGPVGAVVGAVAGGIAGGLASLALEASNAEEAAAEEELDEAIGVQARAVGTASAPQQPGQRNAVSSAAAGAGSAAQPSDAGLAEGPIPPSE
jgi:phage tail tape-measure protein